MAWRAHAVHWPLAGWWPGWGGLSAIHAIPTIHPSTFQNTLLARSFSADRRTMRLMASRLPRHRPRWPWPLGRTLRHGEHAVLEKYCTRRQTAATTGASWFTWRHCAQPSRNSPCDACSTMRSRYPRVNSSSADAGMEHGAQLAHSRNSAAWSSVCGCEIRDNSAEARSTWQLPDFRTAVCALTLRPLATGWLK